MLKKNILLISVVYSLALAALSLFKVNVATPELPSFSDKVFHALAYALFTILWFLAFFYNKALRKNKAILYSVLLSLAFGIIIEVLQGTITEYRTSDFNDVIANASGTMLVAIVLLNLKRFNVKKY